MHPTYFRATAYGNEIVPYIEDIYVVYSTAYYDFCTWDKQFAEKMQGKSSKQIREICKTYGRRLKKIDKAYSRFARKTPKEAVEHLIHRKQQRMRYLKQYVTEITNFLMHAQQVTSDQLIAECNAKYATTYAVTSP